MYVLAVDTGNLELGKVSRTPLNKRIDVDHSDTNSMYTVREQEEQTPVTNRPKLVETPWQSNRVKETQKQNEEQLEIEGASKYALRPKRINMQNMNLKMMMVQLSMKRKEAERTIKVNDYKKKVYNTMKELEAESEFSYQCIIFQNCLQKVEDLIIEGN